ncbi:saccharopine dehydrogenase NADP-binding domain-containing protein [Burkholderia multivorans]|uniref:saccharopine dehydrogenase family protein n=1 Tax=Burkholderia multivorans TaxID=87883 RepID=UPI002019D4E1|nr:saccharopine dehydrogenase NADP-binding domain-containing protein [Burkholderia multivorans]MCO1370210.1 saccharopine dehydrogenase NADP-binding domain-containing protein [Burkholderia multivorans]MCO1459509.1 saccharopine dehydrogenase NADP-binding domain-containing protein [Burkholderia multivorans]MCO1467526.1 saccharopine dehydrogenase NADP-binding domain-containing protein [Burkholderia multivorans]UQO20738.1 saccharopine dehydrogenase NADP-binding domain-containing protein [Burkholderi
MTHPAYDLVVFGATSFVGQILTRHLAEHLSSGADTLRWAIAGRSEAKLAQLRDSLGDAARTLPILVADASDDAQLQTLCAQTRVVVSTVGPYALYGEPLVRACAQSGTDYCDLTGETQWIKRMIDRYEAAATQSGARIVHCCGFDSIPSDLGVYVLQQRALHEWGAPAEHVTMRVKALKGGASGGTVASMINVVREAAADPALRRMLLDPYALCPRDHRFTVRQHAVRSAEFDRDCDAWIAPFVMAAVNERVVHRSNALAGDAYGNGFRYDEAIVTGHGIRGSVVARATVVALGAFMAGVLVKPVRSAMERFLLPKPGEGPSLAAQRAGCFDLRFFGHASGGRIVRLKVTGDRDPGYGSTGKMLGQAAICLALDCRAGSDRTRGGGFWTPATMFGERLVERLVRHAGLRFDAI